VSGARAVSMNREQRLRENSTRIGEAQKELARVERVLGIARLARPESERVRELESEVTALRLVLEGLIAERFGLRKRAAEACLASKTKRAIARERLTELIDDIRSYSGNPGLSDQLRDANHRMLREAVVKRADIARELGVNAKRKVIDADVRWIIDDMLEARFLNADHESAHDLRVIARSTTDILRDLGLLRANIDTGKVREILWTIMKGIIAAAAGSGAMALYHMLSSMDVTGQARAAAQVYEEAWSANRESIHQATSMFAEPVDPRGLFGLLFHLSRAL